MDLKIVGYLALGLSASVAFLYVAEQAGNRNSEAAFDVLRFGLIGAAFDKLNARAVALCSVEDEMTISIEPSSVGSRELTDKKSANPARRRLECSYPNHQWNYPRQDKPCLRKVYPEELMQTPKAVSVWM